MAMSKKDAIPFGLLLALLLAWPYIDRLVVTKFFPNHAPVKPAVTEPAVGPTEADLVAAPTDASAPVEADATAEPVVAVAPVSTPPSDQPPARQVVIANDLVELIVTSRGGALTEATLKQYHRSLNTTEPVVLDFAGLAALAYENLGELGDGFDFNLRSLDGRSVVLERTTASGLRLQRTLTLGERYVVQVVDEFSNESALELALPTHGLRTGPMRRETGHKDSAGVVTLGVDSLSPGGEKVQHWGNRIGKMFTAEMEADGLSALPVLLDVAPHDQAIDWVAAKNKYFVQILTPEGGAETSRIKGRRALAPREAVEAGAAPRKMTELTEVSAAAVFEGQTLAPGEKLERRLTYYVGPKKYSELHAMRLHQVDVMEFGDWIKPISKLLLKVLNGIHTVIPNYGIAIILLTIIVRVVFWPITHKSTESMKRMQQVAPLVTALREKYKDNPTKQQQEIMALYKEHKVNPLGGCLPMLIQIPVFFALFTVLRSAIELRFADFLWIKDLSEPENLFQGMIPFVGSLNLLPLLMSATMYLQMKLSPSSGDPAQQKIMAVMMPIMMLFFLYSFASGLALYWTTQNVLMIIQQMMMKRKNAAAPVPAKA
jgi:YidC/Oxa1 family membrane protein insertase